MLRPFRPVAVTMTSVTGSTSSVCFYLRQETMTCCYVQLSRNSCSTCPIPSLQLARQYLLPPCSGKMVLWSLLIQSVKIPCLLGYPFFISFASSNITSFVKFYSFILYMFLLLPFFSLLLSQLPHFHLYILLCIFYFFLYRSISSTYIFVSFSFYSNPLLCSFSCMHKLSRFYICISTVLINSFVLFVHLPKQTLSLKVEVFANEIRLQYRNIPTTYFCRQTFVFITKSDLLLGINT